MKRKIVSINEEACTGCGLCVQACHEGAIKMINGKARLVSDSYCDGLGACLPACPADAIHIIEREADPFDEQAVAVKKAEEAKSTPPLPCGCPGTMAKSMKRDKVAPCAPATTPADPAPMASSRLENWPVQIKLVPVSAPYFRNSALLVAADCTAFAYPAIHSRFMANKITLIGCPKLDDCDYTEKLTAIIQANEIRSITVLRMEVPCCAGIANAVKQALVNSGKMIPWHVVTISTDGEILEE